MATHNNGLFVIINALTYKMMQAARTLSTWGMAAAMAVIFWPQHAQANAISITLQTGGTFIPDESFDALTESNWLNEMNIGAGYEIFDGFSVSGNFYLSSYDGVVFDDIDESLLVLGGEVEASYALTIVDGLDAYGKLAFGLYFAEYAADLSGDVYLARNDFIPGGVASIGLMAYLPHSLLKMENEDFTVGVTLEVGYRLTPELDFSELEPEGEPGSDDITRSPVDLGTTQFTGFFIRGGIVFRF